ncbi:MAG: hypothetical protein JWM11_4601 [Planctomycetaceae bacterium]|nr:hypothetical protein [Planctomycetaceae bacterium]
MFEILKHRDTEFTEKSRLKTPMFSLPLCFKSIFGTFFVPCEQFGAFKNAQMFLISQGIRINLSLQNCKNRAQDFFPDFDVPPVVGFFSSIRYKN